MVFVLSGTRPGRQRLVRRRPARWLSPLMPATGQITGTPDAGRQPTTCRSPHVHALGVTHRDLRIVVGRPIPSGGLLSGWLAEGDGGDSFGPNPGTLQNGVSFVAGPLGRAFSFDGSDDFVDLGCLVQPAGVHDRLLGQAGSHPELICRHHGQQPHRLAQLGLAILQYLRPVGTDWRWVSSTSAVSP